jgi:MFS family permease
MVIWGTISACTAATQSFGGLIACRFVLGFVEAAYFPGCLFFLSSWYTRKELALRTAILYSGSLISGAFSGLIAAGIVGGLDGARGLRAWRWMFVPLLLQTPCFGTNGEIIEGAMTVFVAICAYFILPNFPRTTKWLTPEERELAVWRLAEDAGESDDDHRSVLWGFRLAVKDVRVYILMLMITCIVSSGGVTNFFPTVSSFWE